MQEYYAQAKSNGCTHFYVHCVTPKMNSYEWPIAKKNAIKTFDNFCSSFLWFSQRLLCLYPFKTFCPNIEICRFTSCSSHLEIGTLPCQDKLTRDKCQRDTSSWTPLLRWGWFGSMPLTDTTSYPSFLYGWGPLALNFEFNKDSETIGPTAVKGRIDYDGHVYTWVCGRKHADNGTIISYSWIQTPWYFTHCIPRLIL